MHYILTIQLCHTLIFSRPQPLRVARSGRAEREADGRVGNSLGAEIDGAEPLAMSALFATSCPTPLPRRYGHLGVMTVSIPMTQSRVWVCLDPTKNPQHSNFPSHENYIEILNITNNPCMEY